MAKHKVTTVRWANDTTLEVTFEDDTRRMIPLTRKKAVSELLRVKGTRIYFSGNFIVDAAEYYDNGEAC